MNIPESSGQPAGSNITNYYKSNTGLVVATEWRSALENEHFVQFYDADTYLLDTLTEYMGAGLDLGEGCVVAATEAHRNELENRLHESGRDVVLAGMTGQYIVIDAAETLAKFTTDGKLDEEKFEQVIGSIVKRAAAGGRRVVVFGEIVALLWADDKQSDAALLEKFWNNLAKKYDFTLFCAYPTNGLNSEETSEQLQHVCGEHSRVIPAESYTGLETEDERMRAIVVLQQKAAMLEAEIAERKRLFVLEQMARAEAERANQMKDEFLATLSHELRTPLNAIIGWSSMMEKGGLDDESQERAVDTIKRNALQQAQLIEDILDVSRMITGKLRLQIAPADVVSVINSAIDSVLPSSRSKNIHIEETLDPSIRRIPCDAGRLQQVIWNLLTNAIKFTGEGGQVGISLEAAGRNIRIEVTDNGRGISPDFLPYIFDRFCQADAAQTRRSGGLGLGLAIVKRLVELHGGTVSADSKGEGLGTTFTVLLPRRTVSSNVIEADRREERVSSLLPLQTFPGVKILLVDDDVDSLEMLQFALNATSNTIETAGSVAEAMEKLEWFEPDVLVSDVGLPGEDGCSLIKKVRDLDAKTGRRTSAIALTAYTRVEDRSRALASGFNMFVPKPVELDELLAAVANLVERR